MLIHLSGYMMNGFSPEIIVQKALDLSDAIDTVDPWFSAKLNNVIFYLERAIVEIKRLESDNEYDTRRGSIETALNLMEKIASNIDHIRAWCLHETSSLSLFDEAEKEYKEDEEYFNEMRERFEKKRINYGKDKDSSCV